ncbi:GNAT family N-acetyltransferase [Isoptericola sediminis]|uniref:GNAT family N-acetyltransferase n=1 Tax=Isoptericola sediminis TaxID=2733572 RepID=A0A849JUP1_9MICO|nr:GNAT family N-acetyltransferase [Isoptericola sediminis]NNU26314.1 GNAT family N-acetyltransferase [Isoptericola sediminis]
MPHQDPGSTTIKALTTDTWPLFAALVERHHGIFGGCWCVNFHPDREDRGPGYDGNRVFKKRLVDEGIAHAALVVRDGDDGEEAIAWAEYGTPAELPHIHHLKQYLAEQDLEPDYRITCIFVDKRFRRHGLVTVALHGALELIARDGGGIVEGYPPIPGERRLSPSFLYNGTRAVYERAGFDFIRPKGMKNTVMRRSVAPSS